MMAEFGDLFFGILNKLPSSRLETTLRAMAIGTRIFYHFECFFNPQNFELLDLVFTMSMRCARLLNKI